MGSARHDGFMNRTASGSDFEDRDDFVGGIAVLVQYNPGAGQLLHFFQARMFGGLEEVLVIVGGSNGTNSQEHRH
jgi:hypothetical protein